MKKKLSDIKFEPSNLGSGSEWIYSFADIMTILLCFFVLFFSAEKNKVSHGLSSFFDQINVNGTSNTPPGEGSLKSSKARAKASAQDNAVSEFKVVRTLTGAEIVKEDEFLVVKFRDVSFFNSSETELNSVGRVSIEEVAKFLVKIQENFIINIIAFTDPTPVKAGMRRRWKSNDELSVLRSIHVSDVLNSLGVNKENMYVTGVVAQSLAYKNLNGNYSPEVLAGKDFSRFRNIAIKLEPK